MDDTDERLKKVEAAVEAMTKTMDASAQEVKDMAAAFASGGYKWGNRDEEKEAQEKENHGEEREEELMSKKAKGRHAEDKEKEMEAVIASHRKPMVDKMLEASAKTGMGEAALAAQAQWLNTLSIDSLNRMAGMVPDGVPAPQLPEQVVADAPSDDTKLLQEMYG